MQNFSCFTLVTLPFLLGLSSCGNESNESKASTPIESAGTSSESARGGANSTGTGQTGGASPLGGTGTTTRSAGGTSNSGGRSNAGGSAASGSASAGGSASGGVPAVGGTSAAGGTTTVVTVPRTDSPWASTEFGRVDSDVATLSTAPSASFYIGGWTHTVEALGTATTGNDYPFVIPCKETVGSTAQLLLMISGNVAYDGGYGSWYYNQNITTNTGDYATLYAHTGQFGYPSGTPDEAGIRCWVYVAWHFRPTSAGTAVSQYLKFGTGGLVLLTEDVVDGTGGWSGASTPVNELVTPKSISIGGGPRGWAKIYMQFVKLYEMTTAPTKDQVNTIALRTDPDPNAWADWPLIGADLADVSGHGRNLTAVDATGKKGNLYSAIPGPKF